MTARPCTRADILLVMATVFATLAIQRQFGSLQPKTALPRRAASIDPPEAQQAHLQRSAQSPIEIRPAGWKEVLLRTYQQINEDRLLAIAAGVVFYGLLALFPAITALVSSYGLFADASTIADNLRTLAVMLPEGSFVVVQDQIARVLAKGSGSLGVTFFFGLLLALWSANAGMKAIMDALNVVYDEEESRSFIKLNLVSLALTIAALTAILVMVVAVVAVPLVLEHIGIGKQTALLVTSSCAPRSIVSHRVVSRRPLALLPFSLSKITGDLVYRGLVREFCMSCSTGHFGCEAIRCKIASAILDSRR